MISYRILIVKSIVHSYGKKNILVNIDFTCKTGDVLGIFGRNGTGKSTLLKILFGTLKPQKSEIYLDYKIVKDTSNLIKYIGYHHLEVFLPLSMTVRNLVTIFLS